MNSVTNDANLSFKINEDSSQFIVSSILNQRKKILRNIVKTRVVCVELNITRLQLHVRSIMSQRNYESYYHMLGFRLQMHFLIQLNTFLLGCKIICHIIQLMGSFHEYSMRMPFFFRYLFCVIWRINLKHNISIN